MDAEFSKILATVPVPGCDDMLAQHLPALADFLGCKLDDDIAIFALAWRFKCKNPTSFTREEWNNGWKTLKVTNQGAAKNIIGGLRAETVPDDAFRSFYDFVFEWSREVNTARFVATETAVAMWPLLWKNRSFGHLTKFIEFLNKKSVKSITRDVWQQMWHFSKLSAAQISSYDFSSAWPSLFDDFVEAVQQKKI
jgi:hypothetical protein